MTRTCFQVPMLPSKFYAVRCHERLLGPLVGNRQTCSGKSWESARISSQSVSNCFGCRFRVFSMFFHGSYNHGFWVSLHPKSDKTNFHLISLVSGKRPIEKESGKKRGTAGTTMWVLWNPLKVQRYQWVLVSPSWYRLRFFLSIWKGSCFKWKWCHAL